MKLTLKKIVFIILLIIIITTAHILVFKVDNCERKHWCKLFFKNINHYEICKKDGVKYIKQILENNNFNRN